MTATSAETRQAIRDAIKDAKKRNRLQGKSSGSFLLIPHHILKSSEFGTLKPWSLKLLLELASNYRGRNNGDLSATFRTLKPRGWNSPGTLSAALKDLLTGGWILTTRHGGKNRCSLYALTWWPINDCAGKLEVKGEELARHYWNKSRPVVTTGTNLVAP